MTEPIPHTVYIAPHQITITADIDTTNVLSQAAGEQLYGNYDPRYSRITVDPNQAPTQLAETVLHELLHACMTRDLEEDQEETVVAALAPRLLGMLRDNPALVTWLCGD